MKRMITCLAMLAMLCALTACGGTQEPSSVAVETTVEETTEAAEETTEETAETTEEETTEAETEATTEAAEETTEAVEETTAAAEEETISPDAPRFTGEDYLGIWGSGRATLTVEEEGDGYLVEIKWASSAAEGSVWTYHCVYKPETWHLHCDGTGIRTDYKYDEDGNVENTVVYEDGSAEIWHTDDGCLGWTDKKENAGEDMTFTQ
ncbi:MAG: hypothetical protein K5695_07715 [Oscillospiraceae bacterium]|nr:hypothetical protein [Oscillospiraceae bacterium]